MALFTQKITLDGSGAGSAQFKNINGIVYAIDVHKGGQTNDPVVTVTESYGAGAVLLNGVTVTANTSYPLVVAAVDNTGAAPASAPFAQYFVGGNLNVTVTGGDASGTLTVWIKVYE